MGPEPRARSRTCSLAGSGFVFMPQFLHLKAETRNPPRLRCRREGVLVKGRRQPGPQPAPAHPSWAPAFICTMGFKACPTEPLGLREPRRSGAREELAEQPPRQ